MRRIVLGLAVVIGIGVALIASVAPAAAAPAPDLRIRGVSCQGEWVDIRNRGTASKNLQGWRIVDHGRLHKFDFPSIVLPAGATVRVWADGKTGGPYARWFTGWGAPVWNNDGDRATLLTPARQVKATRNCDDVGGP